MPEVRFCWFLPVAFSALMVLKERYLDLARRSIGELGLGQCMSCLTFNFFKIILQSLMDNPLQTLANSHFYCVVASVGNSYLLICAYLSLT
jgi:hypothetical protein